MSYMHVHSRNMLWFRNPYLLFLSWSLLNIIIAKAEKSSQSCYNGRGDIKFDDFSNKNLSLIVWKIKKLTGDRFIASLKSGNFSAAVEYKNKVEEVKGDIVLRNVTKNDEGDYIRESKDLQGRTEISMHRLHVLEPPSGPTYIAQRIREPDDTVILTCKGPDFLGHPAVRLLLKDSVGLAQANLTVTAREDVYHCCMEGPATDCRKDIEKCSTVNIKTDRTCERPWTCIAFSFLAWFCGHMILLLSVGVVVLLQKIISKKHFTSIRSTKANVKLYIGGVIFSIVPAIILACLVCINLRESECYVAGFHAIIGGASSLSMLIVPFVAGLFTEHEADNIRRLELQNKTDEMKTKKSEEEEPLNLNNFKNEHREEAAANSFMDTET